MTDTPILRAASFALDGTMQDIDKMKENMEDASDARSAFQSVTTLSPDEKNAYAKYQETIRHISDTSTVSLARSALKDA